MTNDSVAPIAPPIVFAVMIDCPLERADLHSRALDFCRAIIASTHRLAGVFFYGDAVAILDSRRGAALLEQWHAVLAGAAIDGVVCSAAASRRGLADSSGAATAPLPLPLRLGGLGEWVAWSVRAQRVVRFA